MAVVVVHVVEGKLHRKAGYQKPAPVCKARP
jgi:hypothetical protein